MKRDERRSRVAALLRVESAAALGALTASCSGASSAGGAPAVTVARAVRAHLATTMTLQGEFYTYRDILDFAKVSEYVSDIRIDSGDRVKAGNLMAALEVPELSDQLVSAVAADQMSLPAEDKKISLICEADQPVEVEGNRARLKQVVVNLLDNAIMYPPEGGSIRPAVSSLDGEAVVEVMDTGIGIPPDALPHVFERFYRVGQSRSRQPDGAGLGLAIIKSICKAHGREIEAESAPGRGSTFRVRLRLAA